MAEWKFKRNFVARNDKLTTHQPHNWTNQYVVYSDNMVYGVCLITFSRFPFIIIFFPLARVHVFFSISSSALLRLFSIPNITSNKDNVTSNKFIDDSKTVTICCTFLSFRCFKINSSEMCDHTVICLHSVLSLSLSIHFRAAHSHWERANSCQQLQNKLVCFHVRHNNWNTVA